MQAKYSPNANMFVTASKDGDIKIWDGVSNKCVNTFTKSHDGEEVCSVEFSRNSKVGKENPKKFQNVLLLDDSNMRDEYFSTRS